MAAIAHGGLEAAGLAGLEVPDSLIALGALGAGWRAQFSLPLIAVTGSNGKTTVTQMIAAVLAAFRADRALATAGNFNNEIGVPLTLMRLRAQHQLAVLELGMNHPGEIARLAAMSRPTIALVNNAQREHQEFMASVEAVAIENAAVFAELPDDGTAVFPYGDTFTSLWTDLARQSGSRRCLTFGEHADADISLDSAEWQQGAWRVRVRTPLGAFDARLHIAGRHNVGNALAATACALAAGVSLDTIAAGLSAFEPVKGRSRASEVVLPGGHALTLVDDSYNANPDSVIAAIDVLTGLPARACWCSARWARSATARRNSTPRSAPGRANAASTPSTRWAARPCMRRRLSTTTMVSMDAISTISTRSARPCSPACRSWAACWSRVALHEDGARGAGDRSTTTKEAGHDA